MENFIYGGFYKSSKIYFRNVDIVVALEKNSWI